MADGTDDSGGLLGKSDHERVDSQYREPEEPEFELGPDIPEAPDPTGNDIDPAVSTRFWALVGVFNLALLGIGVGAMVALLGGDAVLGGQLFLGGAVVATYGLYRYRQVKRSLRDADQETEQDPDHADRNG